MIEIMNLNQGYKNSLLFKDFNLTIASHKITAIIGESGCGKSTLLKTIAGVLPYKGGAIKGVNRNCISVVFQEDRLLPWLTVEENIGLVLRKNSKDEGSIIDEILILLDIYHYRHSPIQELSGGMQRRVAIARAIAHDKANKGDLLILDEPFKGLDYKLRMGITENLVNDWKKYGKTVLMVTHDFEEAKYVSDNIIELYGNPVKWQIGVD